MTIHDRNIEIPLQVETSNWTLGEIETIEDVMGKPIGAIQGLKPEEMSIKQIIAIAFVSARRQDPEVTADECRELKDSELEFPGGEDDEADLGPLEPAPDA